MAVEGSLDLFQLPEILQIVSQEQKTGILTVQGQDDIIAISFLGGRVVAADALNSTVEDRLGEVLLEQELLTRQEHEAALAEKRRSGRRLMDVLEETGTLERGELLEALRVLTLDLLEKLLTWRQGEFKFYSGEEVSYEEGFRPITVEDLLLANLPQAAERAAAEPSEGEPTEGEPAEVPEPSGPAVASDTVEDAETTDPGAVAEGGALDSQSPVPLSEPSPEPSAELSVEIPAEPEGRPEPDPGRVPLRAVPPPEPLEIRDTPVPAPSETKASGRGARARGRDRARDRRTGSSSRRILALGLGGVAALLLAAVVATAPNAVVLPAAGPEQRESFEDSRREARYAKIESVVRAYALIEGRLPEDLGKLVERGMLPPDEVRGPLGQPLLYEVDGLVYRIRSLLTEEDTAFLSSLRGDFLLDPKQLEGARDGSSKPLVLLD